jgi:hypothetical protein
VDVGRGPINGTWRYDLRVYDAAGNRSDKWVIATAVVAG